MQLIHFLHSVRLVHLLFFRWLLFGCLTCLILSPPISPCGRQHIVEVDSSRVVQHGQVLKFEGEGMPKHDFPSDRGVLEITIKVTMPQRLTDAQQSEIRALLA